jgi:hypothetical protein
MISIYVSKNVQVFFGCFIIAHGKNFSFLICADGEETKLFVVVFPKMSRDQMRKYGLFFHEYTKFGMCFEIPHFFVDSSGFSSEREQILIIIKMVLEFAKFDFFLNRYYHEVPVPATIIKYM